MRTFGYITTLLSLFLGNFKSLSAQQDDKDPYLPIRTYAASYVGNGDFALISQDRADELSLEDGAIFGILCVADSDQIQTGVLRAVFQKERKTFTSQTRIASLNEETLVDIFSIEDETLIGNSEQGFWGISVIESRFGDIEGYGSFIFSMNTQPGGSLFPVLNPSIPGIGGQVNACPPPPPSPSLDLGPYYSTEDGISVPQGGVLIPTVITHSGRFIANFRYKTAPSSQAMTTCNGIFESVTATANVCGESQTSLGGTISAAFGLSTQLGFEIAGAIISGQSACAEASCTVSEDTPSNHCSCHECRSLKTAIYQVEVQVCKIGNSERCWYGCGTPSNPHTNCIGNPNTYPLSCDPPVPESTCTGWLAIPSWACNSCINAPCLQMRCQ